MIFAKSLVLLSFQLTRQAKFYKTGQNLYFVGSNILLETTANTLKADNTFSLTKEYSRKQFLRCNQQNSFNSSLRVNTPNIQTPQRILSLYDFLTETSYWVVL